MERANRAIHDGCKNFRDEEALMTVEELSIYLEVSIDSVRSWVLEGSLNGYRTGKDEEEKYSKVDMIHFLRGVRS